MRTTSVDKDQIRTLHAEGITFTKIANRLGVSRSCISGHIHRMGLKQRDRVRQVNIYIPKPYRTRRTIFAKQAPIPKSQLYAMLREAVENTK
jgi:hypothetical protein